jgi:hypothetical protein
MVAVTKKRDYDELTQELKEKEKVAIFSCNTCTRSMYPPTGGSEAVHKLQKQLEADNYQVTGIYYVTAACFEDIVNQTRVHEQWTTGIVLACESGYAVVKRFVPDRHIIRGLDTLGILMEDGKNKYKPIIQLEI